MQSNYVIVFPKTEGESTMLMNDNKYLNCSQDYEVDCRVLNLLIKQELKRNS